MSSIKPSLLLLSALLALALGGCGDKNDKAVFSSVGGHPSDWAATHKASAKANLESCVGCHGENLDGGIAKVSCTQCHLGSTGAIHPVQWGNYAYARHRGYVATNGTASCANAACHGTALTGASGPNCATACHLGGPAAKHAGVWTQFSSHANYVKGKAFDISSCSTSVCHGTDAKGKFLSGPSCTACHMGTNTTVHPATAGPWETDHQFFALKGLTFVQTRVSCDIAACHGVFNDATKPGQTKVDKTCASTSCHAGDKN